jgi:uncharacterized SAM-binding protein YcdF (DUF218 family)
MVEPLFVALVVLAAVVAEVWRRGALTRWQRVIALVALLGLWIVSTPLGAWMLERPLRVETGITDDASWSPKYIYVLSAGFEIGDREEQDFSGFETSRRVNRAVVLWREHRTATIVMAGTPPEARGRRGEQRQGELMQQQAERLGVPPERIMIDDVSTNTAGHARVAHETGFLSRDTPLAIVTSDFHLRRARKEFSRYFGDLTMVGSDPVSTREPPGWSLRALLPRVNFLGDSTLCMREYVALSISDLRS